MGQKESIKKKAQELDKILEDFKTGLGQIRQKQEQELIDFIKKGEKKKLEDLKNNFNK